MQWLIFFLFEALTYGVLRAALLGFAEPDQWTPITTNWAVAVWFVLGHLAVSTAAYLVLTQRLPQKHRPAVLPWFWRSLLAMVVEVVVLLG